MFKPVRLCSPQPMARSNLTNHPSPQRSSSTGVIFVLHPALRSAASSTNSTSTLTSVINCLNLRSSSTSAPRMKRESSVSPRTLFTTAAIHRNTSLRWWHSFVNLAQRKRQLLPSVVVLRTPFVTATSTAGSTAELRVAKAATLQHHAALLSKQRGHVEADSNSEVVCNMMSKSWGAIPATVATSTANAETAPNSKLAAVKVKFAQQMHRTTSGIATRSQKKQGVT